MTSNISSTHLQTDRISANRKQLRNAVKNSNLEAVINILAKEPILLTSKIASSMTREVHRNFTVLEFATHLGRKKITDYLIDKTEGPVVERCPVRNARVVIDRVTKVSIFFRPSSRNTCYTSQAKAPTNKSKEKKKLLLITLLKERAEKKAKTYLEEAFSK